MSTSSDDYSCGRRFAARFNADEWLNLVEAHTVTEEDLHDRLESNWTAVAGVSGLITGFTYVCIWNIWDSSLCLIISIRITTNYDYLDMLLQIVIFNILKVVF